jgi:hypothetical protein
MIRSCPLALRLALLAGGVAAATLGCSALDVLKNLTGSGTLTINAFTASPTQVVAGSNTTLSWDVSGADSVTIDQGVGTVTTSGSKQVMPASTLVYTLLAKASASTATSSVQVVVLPALH